jgi:hypothetical protein
MFPTVPVVVAKWLERILAAIAVLAAASFFRLPSPEDFVLFVIFAGLACAVLTDGELERRRKFR